MNASILKERTSARPAARGLPAGLIEQIAAPSELARFFGAQMVQVHAALCHPEIEAGDCIAVDFDRREIRHDGLYMITISQNDGSKWYGARRFQFRPAHEGSVLWCFDLGGESWSQVTEEMQSRITVYGEIREVYKPASKLRRQY